MNTIIRTLPNKVILFFHQKNFLTLFQESGSTKFEVYFTTDK
jgi:hypothetical protein